MSRTEDGLTPALLAARPGRAVVVAAHPDDETIGAGGQLPYLPGVEILTVTDGAPHDPRDAHAAGCATRAAYAELRRAELETAMAIAGIPPHRLHGFGISDQQAADDLPALARRLADWLIVHEPELVLTHPFEYGHPDHDAVAFAVHAATVLLGRAGRKPPRVVEFASYHAGPEGLVTGRFPPGAQNVTTIALDPEQKGIKRRMLDAFRSQAATLAPFGCVAERFRFAPAYDFTALPDHGCWYARFDRGLRPEEWCDRARAAIRVLDLPPCL